MVTRSKIKQLEKVVGELRHEKDYFGGLISVPRDRWQDRDKFIEEELERLGVDTEAKDFLGFIVLPQSDPPWPPPDKNH